MLWKLTGDRELFAEAMQDTLLGMWRHLEKLGRSEIDGMEVEGIEAQRENKETIRLWVDVKTNWPVRIESEGQMMSEGRLRPSHIVMDHFQWDAEIDPGLFEPNIPADYTLSGPR